MTSGEVCSSTPLAGEAQHALQVPSTSSIPFQQESSSFSSFSKKKKSKKNKTFCFTQHPHRKIALRLAYHGHAHDGLAIQRDTSNTVEGLLCEALQRIHLIPRRNSFSEEERKSGKGQRNGKTKKNSTNGEEKDAVDIAVEKKTINSTTTSSRSSSSDPTSVEKIEEEEGDKVDVQISRCGRTDKGVSALGNCISLICRSSCWPEDNPQLPPIDYCAKLNRILPSTIRVVGYAHVDQDFDARFSCTARTYRYFFCHQGLDLEAMKKAASYLVGTHNFRNFCVLDVVNVSNLERHMISARIIPSETFPAFISYVELKANSFLYHQVRCIMSVLFLVGRHLEPPSVVQALLHCGDKKPFYPLAESAPLVLWECHYDQRNPVQEPGTPCCYQYSSVVAPRAVEWQLTTTGLEEVQQSLLDISTALLIRATAINAMREQLSKWYSMTVPGAEVVRRKGDGGKSNRGSDGETGLGNNDSSHSQIMRLENVKEKKEQQQQQKEDVLKVTHADHWSCTGYDWTLPNADDRRRSRYFSVVQEKKQEKSQNHEAKRIATNNRNHNSRNEKNEEEEERELRILLSSFPFTTGEDGEEILMDEERKKIKEQIQVELECIQGNRRNRNTHAASYIPLLLRESERTFQEQVMQLSGAKRTRYEENVRKKNLYDEAVSQST